MSQHRKDLQAMPYFEATSLLEVAIGCGSPVKKFPVSQLDRDFHSIDQVVKQSGKLLREIFISNSRPYVDEVPLTQVPRDV